MDTRRLLHYLTESVTYDLGRDFHPGMAHNRAHPPFVFSRESGPAESSPRNGAACFFIMGGHTGPHIDALGHFAEGGHVYGYPDQSIFELEDEVAGLAAGGIEKTPPILRRGVLVDLPRLHGWDILPADHEICAADLDAAIRAQQVAVHNGDVLLIRTGWMQNWQDQRKYCGTAPGVNQAGAQWLADHGVSLTGNDTSAFEKMDKTHKQVHILLLARRGIQIMENLYLEELARDAKWEFIFVALPLRIRGGTASPIRPIAICQ